MKGWGCTVRKGKAHRKQTGTRWVSNVALSAVLGKPEKRQENGITWSRAGSCGAWGTLQWHSGISSPLAPSPWPGCPTTEAKEPNADPMGLSPSWAPLTTCTATFPLPAVINRATILSLQDPSRKSWCSTLPHHIPLPLPGSWPFGLVHTSVEAMGSMQILPVLQACGVCCCRINTLCCPLTLPTFK